MRGRVEDHFKKYTLAAPDRILVATDLTDADYLLPHVIAQARAAGSQVTLIHVITPADLVPVAPDAFPYVDKAKIIRDIRIELLGMSRQIESQGIACDTAVREGIAGDAIRKEIGRVDATRLIMGTHGRGKLGRLALGSVAQELIARVDIPVFVVGPLACNSAEHVVPRKILHPVSFMGDYEDSVRLALEIAQTYRAELILLHVLDQDLEESVNPQRTIDWAKKALQDVIPDANLIPPVRVMVAPGKLADEVLKAAVQTNTDWIVLGANGEFRTWTPNAAYKVLTAANCPVLTLRHEPYRIEARDVEEVHFTFPLR